MKRDPVLLLRHDAVARILANGNAAFIESCAAVGWNSCDSARGPSQYKDAVLPV